MNIREHKRAYLSTFLIVISVVILGLLILWTGNHTIPTNDTLKSGIQGSSVVMDCEKKTPCPAKRLMADIAVTDANGKSLKATSETDGTFTFKLAPGMYTASAIAKDKKLHAPSQQVTVEKDTFTRITFNFE
jgi:hypothetical protein